MAKPAEAADRERKKIQRRASKKQYVTDPRSLIAAGYVMIVTPLPADLFPADEIAALYRLRWQIELAFKRLKSILRIDQLRAFDPELART
ncbi:MAG: transposase [Alphaproteobacteria bacterium]|nr:transposase [Alphaproteobacteria bacterium]